MAGRSIPTVPRSALGSDRQPFDTAVKENLDLLLGRQGGTIQALPSGATLAEVVAKLNEIIARLQ